MILDSTVEEIQRLKPELEESIAGDGKHDCKQCLAKIARFFRKPTFMNYTFGNFVGKYLCLKKWTKIRFSTKIFNEKGLLN